MAQRVLGEAGIAGALARTAGATPGRQHVPHGFPTRVRQSAGDFVGDDRRRVWSLSVCRGMDSQTDATKGTNGETIMTKRDLVIRISNDTNLIQQDVLTVVQKTLDYITEALIKGETVELRNFGVFEVKLRKPRVGRNPNDPDKDVQIPARAVVK